MIKTNKFYLFLTNKIYCFIVKILRNTRWNLSLSLNRKIIEKKKQKRGFGHAFDVNKKKKIIGSLWSSLLVKRRGFSTARWMWSLLEFLESTCNEKVLVWLILERKLWGSFGYLWESVWWVKCSVCSVLVCRVSNKNVATWAKGYLRCWMS